MPTNKIEVPDRSGVLDLVRRALNRAGLSLPRLRDSAQQVILFGSHAAGVARRDSDVDLALIGNGQPRLTTSLDLIWVQSSCLGDPKWLGSEIATHIATYGVWLSGDDSWRRVTRVSDQAIDAKVEKIVDHLHALERSWEILAPPYRAKHISLLRRDLQRLDLLRRREAVCPTPLLDSAWTSSSDPVASVTRWTYTDLFAKAEQSCLRNVFAPWRSARFIAKA